MNRSETIRLICRWENLVNQYDQNIKETCNFLNWFDSPIDQSQIQEFSEELLSMVTGINLSALHWFRYENKFGSKGLICRNDRDDECVIDSIEAFVDFELS